MSSGGYSVGGNGGGGGGASFNWSATAWVDPSGNDGTGEIGNAYKPFKNPQAAQTALLIAGKAQSIVIVNAGQYLTSSFKVIGSIRVYMMPGAVVTQDDGSQVVSILDGDNNDHCILGYGEFYATTDYIFKMTGFFGNIAKLNLQFTHIEGAVPMIYSEGQAYLQLTGISSNKTANKSKAPIICTGGNCYYSGYAQAGARISFINCDFTSNTSPILVDPSDFGAKLIVENCNVQSTTGSPAIQVNDAIHAYLFNGTKLYTLGPSSITGNALANLYCDNNVMANQPSALFAATLWQPLIVDVSFVIP